MAAPVAGEVNLPLQKSDLHLSNESHTRIDDSLEDDFTISQLAKSTTLTSLPKPPPPALSTSLLGTKRRKKTPVRYGGSTSVVEKIDPPSKPTNVAHDPSTNCLTSSPAMIRAAEIKSSLGSEHPRCIRLIVKAHIIPGHWMGFPQPFGKQFLPRKESDMIIEDENMETHHVKYIAYKNIGLGAGWKKFASGHNLLEGDVLIFHLIEPFKFKVYIVRANDLALSISNVDSNRKQVISETDSPSQTTNKRKRTKLLPPSQEIASEVPEDSRTSKQDLSSEELENFRNFHIMVKGQCIDSELPEDVRIGFYKLCMGRKELLHDDLSKNLYYKLVAGMIGEIVDIANKIKKCKLTVSNEELAIWDNSLKSFEILGMRVGFLRERIGKLSKIVLESDVKRYVESKNKKKDIEEEIIDVMDKLLGLKEKCKKMEGIVGDLKEKVSRYEMKFQQEVDAPW